MHGTPESTFANKLRDLREEKRLSQSQVAAMLSDKHGIKLDPTAITRLEGGSRTLRLDEAVALADVLGTSLDRMLGQETEELLSEQEREVQTQITRLESETRLLIHAAIRLDSLIRRAAAEGATRARLNPPKTILAAAEPIQIVKSVLEEVRDNL
jgi:transcriptional regulator with XRE-family HTH domain